MCATAAAHSTAIAARKAALDVAHKAILLLALGSYKDARLLVQAVGPLGHPPSTDRSQLVWWLRGADSATTQDAAVLIHDGIALSPQAAGALTSLSPADIAAAAGGQSITLGWTEVLAGLDDLVNRNGQAPASRVRPDPAQIAAALLTDAGQPSAPSLSATPSAVAVPATPAAQPAATPATTVTPRTRRTRSAKAATARKHAAAAAPKVSSPSRGVTTPTGPPATPTKAPAIPAARSTSHSPPLPLLIGLLLTGAAVALLAVRRFRAPAPAPPPQPRHAAGPAMSVEELLDVSSRLAAITAAPQIHRALVREALGLVRARTGAVVVRHGDQLAVGYEAEHDLLVPGRLGEGVIARVAETGQAVAQVSAAEPAIRGGSVAVLAAPLIIEGSVSAVLVLVRPPADPFSSTERAVLCALAPVASSAILASERAASAMEQSLLDPMTGAGNRRRLDLELARTLASSDESPTALVMIDVDHFKQVNDRFGHVAGDTVLKAVVEVMRRTLRPGDTIYRYGGEEFAVILPCTSIPDALAVAERIRVAVEADRMPLGDGRSIRATASLGVGIAPPGTDTPAEELVSLADAALYRAKSSGRNRVCASDPVAVKR